MNKYRIVALSLPVGRQACRSVTPLLKLKVMKGTNLGEFEELVLLTIATLLDNAYSVNICDEIESNTGRKVKLGVVHAVLNRLEEKGFINSHLGEATRERGGRRKRFFEVSHSGKMALLKTKEQRDKLWNTIPDVVFKGIQS